MHIDTVEQNNNPSGSVLWLVQMSFFFFLVIITKVNNRDAKFSLTRVTFG